MDREREREREKSSQCSDTKRERGHWELNQKPLTDCRCRTCLPLDSGRVNHTKQHLIDVSYCPTTPYLAQSTHTFVTKGEPCVVNHTRFVLVGWSRNMRNFRAAKDVLHNTALEKMSLTRKNLNFRKQKPIKTFKTKEPGLH